MVDSYLFKLHHCIHNSTKSFNSTREDPPSLSAATASYLALKTLSLTSFPLPLSESISSLTRSSNSLALTNPSSFSFNAKATFISSTITTLFNLCSAYKGHDTIGTPQETASNTEFHPQ
ncbi:hypothetical protein GmHk_09G025869 [Glycine max]|nr:hypothetical protein GmHk_09G025869 [Glycine max]